MSEMVVSSTGVVVTPSSTGVVVTPSSTGVGVPWDKTTGWQRLQHSDETT